MTRVHPDGAVLDAGDTVDVPCDIEHNSTLDQTMKRYFQLFVFETSVSMLCRVLNLPVSSVERTMNSGSQDGVSSFLVTLLRR